MKLMLQAALCAAIGALGAAAADSGTAQIAKVYDQQLTSLERELVPLAEAMPAERFSFAPTEGQFSGVRTFALQAEHIAYVLYEVSAGILEQKNPSETGPSENGPANLKTKEDVVNYLKQAFAYGHKAMASLTNANQLDMVASPFGDGKVARVSLASIAVWHSFDHYGQMVVYARMNGVIPPASRR